MLTRHPPGRLRVGTRRRVPECAEGAGRRARGLARHRCMSSPRSELAGARPAARPPRTGLAPGRSRPSAAVVGVVLGGLLSVAIKRYVDRATASVRQLRMLDEQLQAEIAQRRAAEEENAGLTRAAARATALEELSRLKSEVVSIASHELRTPIAAILGFSPLLLR